MSASWMAVTVLDEPHLAATAESRHKLVSVALKS